MPIGPRFAANRGALPTRLNEIMPNDFFRGAYEILLRRINIPGAQIGGLCVVILALIQINLRFRRILQHRQVEVSFHAFGDLAKASHNTGLQWRQRTTDRIGGLVQCDRIFPISDSSLMAASRLTPASGSISKRDSTES